MKVVEEVVKDLANTNKTADNGNKVIAPFSMIIIQEIQMEEIMEVTKEVVEVVEVVAVEVIHHEIIQIINEDGAITIITTITTTTSQIIITTKEEWEEDLTRATQIITTKTIIIQITINPINLLIRSPRIIHRIASQCNFVNFIKLTNAQILNAKDFMDLQKVI